MINFSTVKKHNNKTTLDKQHRLIKKDQPRENYVFFLFDIYICKVRWSFSKSRTLIQVQVYVQLAINDNIIKSYTREITTLINIDFNSL